MTEGLAVKWEDPFKARWTSLCGCIPVTRDISCSSLQSFSQSFFFFFFICLEASVDSHVEDLGAAFGSGELHRREVCALPESHWLLRPLHRRGVLQSAWQWRGGGGTSSITLFFIMPHDPFCVFSAEISVENESRCTELFLLLWQLCSYTSVMP